MRVLVAGAGGLLGLPTARALAAAGHDVVGLIRSSGSARRVEAVGARAVVGDVLAAETLRAPANGVEAVIHLAGSGAEREARVDGCRNLLAAARDAGARRFVLGSGYWLYGDQEETIREDTPPRVRTSNLEAEEVALEVSRAGGPEALIVRPGMVYGNGGWFAEMVRALRTGTYRFVGDGSNRWSPVHPSDVGEAFRAVLERGAPRNAYLVCDDAPVSPGEFAGFVAELLGASRPVGMSFAEAEAALGPDLARAYAANQAASNAKLRSLGWRPRHRTYREGVPSVLGEIGGSLGGDCSRTLGLGLPEPLFAVGRIGLRQAMGSRSRNRTRAGREAPRGEGARPDAGGGQGMGVDRSTARGTSSTNAGRSREMPKTVNDYRVFFADTPRALRPVVTALRAMVRKTAPGLVEIMRHGMPNFAAMEDRYKPTLVYLMSANDHVNLGFYDGVSLKDPRKLLEGTGKRLRHVKVYTAKQARDPALGALVRDAVRVHAAEPPPKRSR